MNIKYILKCTRASKYMKLYIEFYSVKVDANYKSFKIGLQWWHFQIAQVVHCNRNRRCIMLTVPSIMLLTIILVKLYTFQFNSSKVRQCQNLYSIVLYWSKNDHSIILLPFAIAIGKLSDKVTLIEDVSRSKVSQIICVTIGRNWRTRRNAKLWKHMGLTRDCCPWYIRVRIISSIFIFTNDGRLFRFVAVYSYIAMTIFLSVSFIPKILDVVLPLNESRPIIMPYEAYYFVDGGEYFFYIYLHVFVGLSMTISTILGHDCMLLAYIQHVCSLFAIAG